MNEQLKRSLSIWGADIDGAVRRFAGNEALYKKFLYKFLQDKTYESLSEAVKTAIRKRRCALLTR